jgi:anti-sigma regulatory factor (Ser/Thr protein kinase)
MARKSRLVFGVFARAEAAYDGGALNEESGAMENTPTTRLIYVRFRPAWAYLDGVREFCRFFCATTFDDEEVAERMQVVVQEALENAVRYSNTQGADLEVSIESDGAQIEVVVESEPAPGHLDRLRAELEQLTAIPAEQAYAMALQRAAEASVEGLRGFGLARILHEGRMELRLLELEDSRRIRLVAGGKL